MELGICLIGDRRFPLINEAAELEYFVKQKSLKAVPYLTVIIAILVLGLALACAQRPRRVSGAGSQATIIVRAGEDLQAAIDEAHYGDTVVVEAGAAYAGPLRLRHKGVGSGNDADYITIRTSDLTGISREGQRVNPTQHARSMPKIVSQNGQAAVNTEPRAHHYKFVGIEFAPATNSKYVYNLIDLGQSDYTTLSQFPHHLVFDRCYVHSPGLNRARRGFALNSAETSILNSDVSGFAGEGDETQAIAGWNGPGPFHIVNNYLEGGAEVLLFGGSDPSIAGLVPSDIEIRRNYFSKRAEWDGKATIKGTFELKNARRVVVDGNVIEAGIRVTALVITVRNQNGKSPWSTIEDVEITNNVIRHASAGVNILGSDNEHSSQSAKRLRVANNLFEDVANPSDIANFLIISGAESVTIEHNTVQQAGNVMSAYGQPTKNFVFRNNILQHNSYGIACFINGPACPEGASCNCFPDGLLRGNLIADNANVGAEERIEKKYPSGNLFVSSYESIGFMDYAHGNWQLATGSRYRGKATDGKDPGVDFGALEASGVKLAKGGMSK
jgi:hypothetical protein